MTALAFALLATLPFATAGWLGGTLADRLTPSPGLRERLWSLAFVLPLLAGAIPVLALMFPRPAPQGPPILLSTLMKSGSVPPTTPAKPDALAATWDGIGDHGPTLLLAVIVIGVAIRVAGLVLRHKALSVALRTARPLMRDDLNDQLARDAAVLRTQMPPVALSDQVCTPVLVGLRRPSILIPTPLAELPTDRLALICAHELAHLKGRDNVRLLAEDLLLALLWFNPVQTAVHQRLIAVREEARDAIALAGAAPETRRRYAETLVEILRMGAGPGLKTAFIGAGRKGTAIRLKAILKPRAEASCARKVAAGGLALLLLAGAGAGSLAVAAQVGPKEKTTSRISGGPLRGGFMVTSDYMQILPNGVLRWHGDPQVRFDRPGDYRGLRAQIDGLPAPVGFRPEAIDPKSVAWIEGRDGERPMTLNFVRKGSTADRRQAKYDGADAIDYQRFCASQDAGERGFCAGVIFGAIGKSACLPDGLDIVATPERVIPIITAAHPKAGEPIKPFVADAVKAAFPCPAEEA